MDISKYSYILDSKNPDKKIEYFWLTLKDCFVEYLNEKQKTKIKQLSKDLDTFQQLKEFNNIIYLITKFLETEFTTISWTVIFNLDYTIVAYLLKNIKRWNLLNESITKYDKYSFAFLNILRICEKKISENKNVYKKVPDYVKQVAKFELEDNINEATDIVYLLAEYAIKNNMVGIIDYIRPLYSLNKYFDTNTDKYFKTKKLLRYKNI